MTLKQESVVFNPPLIGNLRVTMMFVKPVFTICSNCYNVYDVNYQLKLKFTLDCKACTHDSVVSAKWNQHMKYIHGNILRVVQYNKGKSFINRYVPLLEDFINTTVPHICCLSEANLEVDSDLAKNGLHDFALEASTPPPTRNFSRTAILIRNNLPYKRRKDLEPAGLAVVVLEVSLKKSNM